MQSRLHLILTLLFGQRALEVLAGRKWCSRCDRSARREDEPPAEHDGEAEPPIPPLAD